jgi:hypothetical protein
MEIIIEYLSKLHLDDIDENKIGMNSFKYLLKASWRDGKNIFLSISLNILEDNLIRIQELS